MEAKSEKKKKKTVNIWSNAWLIPCIRFYVNSGMIFDAHIAWFIWLTSPIRGYLMWISSNKTLPTWRKFTRVNLFQVVRALIELIYLKQVYSSNAFSWELSEKSPDILQVSWPDEGAIIILCLLMNIKKYKHKNCWKMSPITEYTQCS